jgi:hypothetical protein
LFVPGPFDTPGRCDRISLTERLGPDGFNTVVIADEDELMPFDVSFDAPDDEWDD